MTVRIRTDRPFREVSLVFGGEKPEWKLEDGYYTGKIKKLGIIQTIKLTIQSGFAGNESAN